MKYKSILFLILLAPFMNLFSQKGITPLWTEADRQLLLKGLQNTQQELITEIEGLNEAQIAFKQDSSNWSIAEVIEHLGTFEELLQWDLYCNQFTPEQIEGTQNTVEKDKIMTAYATDTVKGKAPSVALPLGRFKKLSDLKKYFNYHRNQVIKWVESTNTDLRKHVVYRPSEWGHWAERDLHQYVLVYIAHTTRHTQQIQKIKSSNHFPKSGKIWSEEDRKYLLAELERTQKEVREEVDHLSYEQWHFKPSPEAWSIGQVVEHLGLYERIFLQEAWLGTEIAPQPEYYQESLNDSIYLSWMAENTGHQAPENAIPMGFMRGRDNFLFFNFGRDNILQFVRNTQKDLKLHFTPRAGEPNDKRSIHGLLVIHFSHTDRHLRQIKRIKANVNYPE